MNRIPTLLIMPLLYLLVVIALPFVLVGLLIEKLRNKK